MAPGSEKERHHDDFRSALRDAAFHSVCECRFGEFHVCRFDMPLRKLLGDPCGHLQE